MEPKDQQLHKEIKLLNIKGKEFSALAAENSFFTNDKQFSPIKVMLLLVVIAFAGVVLGFFNPGLSY